MINEPLDTIRMGMKFIASDIEATGPTPMNYSMMSLGACVVGDPENPKKQFYRELKPINNGFTLPAIKVGCLGLKCLEDVKHLPEFNPESGGFNPRSVLDRLEKYGQKPKTAMAEFGEFVRRVGKNYEGKTRFVARPTGFDAMFVHCYFDLTGVENPFGYGGIDSGSYYKGVAGDLGLSVSDAEFWPGETTHNALDDAVQEAKGFLGSMMWEPESRRRK